MKILYFILIISLCLGCNIKKVDDIQEESTSTVVVKMTDADNHRLVLSIQGEDFENKITRKVKNGQAIFNVPYEYSDIAWIESEYNLNNINGNRTYIQVLLENDTIVVQSDLVKDSIQYAENEFVPFYVFDKIRFNKGTKNNVLRDATEKLFKPSKDIVYSFETLDSLNNIVFPSIRKKALDLFKNEFNSIDQRIKADLLNKMLDFHSFNPAYLNESERKSINNIYNSFSNIKQTYDYRYKILEHQIEEINNYNNEDHLSFVDFNLIDIENNSVSLNNIVKTNDYTVLYFWFSNCGPCRRFNARIDKSLIQELRDKKVEIISINTDFNKHWWKKATEQDDIFWGNLYGGHIRDDIEISYRINGYPTKVIFNKAYELVDYKFLNPDELLGIGKVDNRVDGSTQD